MSYSARKRWAAVLSVAFLAGVVLLSMPAQADASASDDLWLMARTIYAEAAGEPYMGKVAVGAVIMNRVRSPLFPNTVAGVIYEPWQFSCVGNWMFNSRPDQDSLNAARDAMNGVDPTGGALFYFNYHTVTNSWLWAKPFAARIGNHWFTY
ncbi:MAG: cell wall hydrolase [Bacillota bacterium]